VEVSGYYPDGVSGNEYQIAGADREYTDTRTLYCSNEDCADFEVEKDIKLDLQSYGSNEWGSWDCPTCGKTNEYEDEIPYEQEDPDEAYERMRDNLDNW
jgi:hypothetical protein